MAAFREELVTWSLRQTRDNLVEWFSFELERFIEHLEDSELGISDAAKELEMPRHIRREIERDAKKSAKKPARKRAAKKTARKRTAKKAVMAKTHRASKTKRATKRSKK